MRKDQRTDEKRTDENSNNKKLAILAVALFHFIFLGTEYLFDNRMAYVVDSQGVVLAQSYILGASVIGFFLFWVFHRFLMGNWKQICFLGGTCIAVICIFLMEQNSSYEMIFFPGLIFFVVLGIMGSGIHYLVFAVSGESRHLAKMMGMAYAIGISFQFLNNHFGGNEVLRALILSLAFMCFVMLFMRLGNVERLVKEEVFLAEKLSRESQGSSQDIQEKKSRVVPESKKTLFAGISLIACVILMTCVFSTLDIAVTMVHATGSVDIGQWPRLLLAVSGLLAGILYDIKDRQYMTVIMYCVTLLSTICVVVIQMGGPFLAGLVVFYLSAGFFVVFFTVSFLEFAQYVRIPELWAGMGRAVNNLCAVLTASLSVALLKLENGMLLMITTLVLFVGITITIYIYQSQLRRQSPETDGMAEVDATAKFTAFSETFSLTEREQEVLKVLLASDSSVQEIAEQLLISRAALYRHITSLNEKTQTKSRIGLLQFYYGWKKAE